MTSVNVTTNKNTITVQEGDATTVTVSTVGPQGPQGIGGEAGIADDSIAEVKLDIHAAPSGTDKFLGFTSNGMEWAVPPNTTYSIQDGELSQNNFTNALKTKLDSVESNSTADQTGAEIKVAYEGESDTNAYTDAEKTKLAGVETSATADQTDAEIRAAVEAASDSNVFTDADHTKLNAIESGATADQTGAEIKTAYEAESDTNAFTDSEKTKLSGIATGATNTAAPYYTSAISVGDGGLTQNNFTNADHTKLDGIEASADVTDATNVDAAGAVMNSDLDGKGELLVGDGSGDPTALAAGTNGYVLKANDSTATGLEWSAAGSGGEANQNAFSNVAVSGQTTVAADSSTDTLNIAAGSNVTITTNATSDTVTIASTDTNTQLSNAEVRTAVEAASDSNVFTDADHTKLNGIATSANNYVHPNHSGEVTSSADGATVIASNIVDEDNLKISNSPSNGTFLQYKDGTDELTWATPTNTQYTAGTGLQLSGTEFSVTSLALTTVQEAANETAMLALTTQEGDVVVRTDENKTYVKNSGSAGTMADFTLLRTPTDAVLSVNGNTGAITAAQIASAVEAASDSNTFTDADHTKLNGIATGAEVNVQSDWNSSSGDSQILNKPTIPTNTDTTYSISCVDGDNTDEEKIRLTAGGDGSGTDDVVLEAGTGLSIARSGDKITFTNTVTDTNTQLTTEEVQDIIGLMVDGGTETNISVTYDDTNGKLDFVSTNTTYNVVDSSANGLAPQLPGSHGGKFLKADGTWEVPPNTQVAIDDTPADGVTDEAISSNWAYDHNAATGNSAHVPSAGSSGQFLKHDGTWGTPSDATKANLSGAEFTGKVTQTSTAVSALDIDCSTSNYFTKAISADSTFTFSNVPSNGQAYGFVLELDVSGDRTLTWPAAVKWNGGSAPTLTADKTHLFSLVTVDNGTTWRGSAAVDYTT